VLWTWTVLVGLILISTPGSRDRLTLPTMTNSPRVMLAVVINISACALSHHEIQAIVAAVTVLMSFARTAGAPGHKSSIPSLKKNKTR
jgi:hypothetical protein